MIVETIAAKKRLPPDARPRAATDQMLAAVDIPRTELPRSKIDLAPRKPIPDTTCAAIREKSMIP